MPTNVDTSIDPDGSSDLLLNELSGFGLFRSRSLSLSQIQQLSPAALAYIGDAVYELFIRQHYLIPPQRIHTFHRQVVAQVRAEAQAHHLQTLIPHLTDVEMDWLRRGRNAATNRSRRVDAETYQQATSLETLMGYLYLTDPQRLFDLLNLLDLVSAQNI